MRIDVAIVKVENGYVVRINKARYIAKSLNDVAEIIGAELYAEFDNMESKGKNHIELNIVGNGSQSN